MEKILHIIKSFIPHRVFNALQPIYHVSIAFLAAVIYGFPSNKLIVIGVTGTTGKTTSVYLIAKLLTGAGYKTGFTSTAIFNDGEKEWLNDKKMTMVGRFYTQKLLRRMLKNNCRFAIIETTSEGIVQYRHRFINYDTLVFTGLYPEHIESHGSFENYKKAKGRLFSHLKKCRLKYANKDKKIMEATSGLKRIELEKIPKFIIVNGDDKYAEYFLSFPADHKIAYSRNESNVNFGDKIRLIKYNSIKASASGVEFFVENKRCSLKLLGEFNAVNAMNAISIGLVYDIDFPNIIKSLKSIDGVAGRMERIDEGQNFIVLVDYAFEPGALGKLYKAIKLIPHKRVIHVLGSAGGGRDIARRPVLGELAAKNADFVLITNEDPYDEDPEVIIRQVAFGAEKAGKKKKKNLFLISDRRKAIKKALGLAQDGDLVLITGKGSEQAICVANGKKIPWDDRVIVRDILSVRTKKVA